MGACRTTIPTPHVTLADGAAPSVVGLDRAGTRSIRELWQELHHAELMRRAPHAPSVPRAPRRPRPRQWIAAIHSCG